MRFSIQKIQQFNAANTGTQNAPLPAAATVLLITFIKGLAKEKDNTFPNPVSVYKYVFLLEKQADLW